MRRWRGSKWRAKVPSPTGPSVPSTSRVWVRRAGSVTSGDQAPGQRHALAEFIPTESVSRSTIGRIWKAFGFKPRQVDTLKISNDGQFHRLVSTTCGLDAVNRT
jgi:hypothetical protein